MISLVGETGRMKGTAVPGDSGAHIGPTGRVIGLAGGNNARTIVETGASKIKFGCHCTVRCLLICPRCEQGEILEAHVKESGVQIFVCDECDAFWFSLMDIGVSPFRDLETYLEENSIAPSWESISVDERR
ncbi:hypothetical protein [Stenotrophomonas maltophilia]|uniref:hypothetical protein n=1 Tax=Stenotrophomonas maltophilia TaxID=40324 RepID=UPI0034DACDB8